MITLFEPTKMQDKKKRKYYRKLAGIAYERELSNALNELQGEFTKWQNGEIDSFELNQKVHEFHHGVSRDLYKLYDMGHEWITAPGAIYRGIIAEDELEEPYKAELMATVELHRL